MQRKNVQTLAQASWALPLVAIFLNVTSASQPPDIRHSIAMTGACIFALGLALGIFSLVMAWRHGATGILKNAIIGCIVSGGLLLLMVAAMAFAKSWGR